MIQRAKKRILAAVLTLALLLTQTALYAQAETAETEGSSNDGGGYTSITDLDEQQPGGDSEELGGSARMKAALSMKVTGAARQTVLPPTHPLCSPRCLGKTTVSPATATATPAAVRRWIPIITMPVIT